MKVKEVLKVMYIEDADKGRYDFKVTFDNEDVQPIMSIAISCMTILRHIPNVTKEELLTAIDKLIDSLLETNIEAKDIVKNEETINEEKED